MRAIHTVLAFILLIAPGASLASGTYRGGPPRQPTSVDREVYDQGKQVFTGKAAGAAETGDAQAQRALLTEWQSRLPARVQATTDLPALAGTLSDAQIKALEYYLGIRYKLK